MSMLVAVKGRNCGNSGHRWHRWGTDVHRCPHAVADSRTSIPSVPVVLFFLLLTPQKGNAWTCIKCQARDGNGVSVSVHICAPSVPSVSAVPALNELQTEHLTFSHTVTREERVASSPEEQMASMAENLEKLTGKSLDQWTA